MSKNDFLIVNKLGKYLKKERKRLILILLILIPVALAGAIQPLLVGQAFSILRVEEVISFFDNFYASFFWSGSNGSCWGNYHGQIFWK